jgi:Fe-S-cluster-containing dehydrogenase component
MPYAMPQPETGQFWLKVRERVRGTVPKVKVSFIPVMCQHCDDAPCISVCTKEAIFEREDGLVLVDPKKCTGCQLCIDACPYGVIYYNKEIEQVQKCTGCAHLLDRGWPIKEPRCADSCINQVLIFRDKDAYAEVINRAEMLPPDFGPQVNTKAYYISLPKRFIAGTVYDPEVDEVVIGATCTLSGDSTASVTTDGFGDFWFEGLAVGNYSLKIEAAGKTYTQDSVNTEKDVNLGDIQLPGGSAANPEVKYPPIPLVDVKPPVTIEPIVSPDGKVQIIAHNYFEYYDKGILYKCVDATIENISDSKVKAKVSVEFIDINGKPVETQSVTVELEKGKFKAIRIYSGGGAVIAMPNVGWAGSQAYNISITTE